MWCERNKYFSLCSKYGIDRIKYSPQRRSRRDRNIMVILNQNLIFYRMVSISFMQPDEKCLSFGQLIQRGVGVIQGNGKQKNIRESKKSKLAQ